MIQAFAKATGQTLAYRWADPRPGDLAAYYADVKKAHEELNWQAERSLQTLLKDAWRWAQRVDL